MSAFTIWRVGERQLGGSDALMAELNVARDEARKERA